ncbi:DNA ligase LigA-related protein [Bacillus thuringiensis]|uniref:DNA ligase LigA-related protein n=1 Tax=Bacillus thuringiensis TaxID=1428 RepID=UPI001111F58C|nr:hypothetical protein FHE73_30675 [Bacillus thuringiensis]
MNEDIKELITRCRHQILVHACIYYRLNDNIVSDYTYDAWAKELTKLQAEYLAEAKAAELAKEFEEFDGDTTSGFNLPIHHPYTVSKAICLLQYHHNRHKKGQSLS